MFIRTLILALCVAFAGAPSYSAEKKSDATKENYVSYLDSYVLYGRWPVIDGATKQPFNQENQVVMQAFDRIVKIIETQNDAFKAKAEREHVRILVNKSKIREAIPENLFNASLRKELEVIDEQVKRAIDLVRSNEALSIQQFTIWQNADLRKLISNIKQTNHPDGSLSVPKYHWKIFSYENLFIQYQTTIEVILRRDGLAMAKYPMRIIGSKPSKTNPFQVDNLDLYMDTTFGAENSSRLTDLLLRAQIDALYEIVSYAMISPEAYFDSHYFNLIYWLFEPPTGKLRKSINDNWTWIQRGLAFYFVQSLFADAFPENDFHAKSYSSLGLMMVSQDDVPSLETPSEKITEKINNHLQQDLHHSKPGFHLNYWPARIMQEAFRDIGLEGFVTIYQLTKNQANKGKSYDKAFKKAYQEVTQTNFDEFSKKLIESYKKSSPNL